MSIPAGPTWDALSSPIFNSGMPIPSDRSVVGPLLIVRKYKIRIQPFYQSSNVIIPCFINELDFLPAACYLKNGKSLSLEILRPAFSAVRPPALPMCQDYAMAQAAASLVSVPTSRSRHAVIAVFMQMMLAVVYSWSVFRGPLTLLYGWSKAQTIMPYRYQLVMVAVGSVIGGLWQDRVGARLVATVGGLMLVFGCVLASFFGGNIFGLVLVYGVIA